MTSLLTVSSSPAFAPACYIYVYIYIYICISFLSFPIVPSSSLHRASNTPNREWDRSGDRMLLRESDLFHAWQSRCVWCDCVGVGVVRHAYHLAQILRAQATRSEVSSRSIVTESDSMSISMVPGDLTSTKEACGTSVSFQRCTLLGNVRRCKSKLKRARSLFRGSTVNQSGRCRRTWTSVVKFKSKYGAGLQEEGLPAQAYCEEFWEKLAAGMLQAEPLDHNISQAEAEEQDRPKPELRKQYGMHLNASLTIQTRRRFTSNLPRSLEELRQKYDVLSNWCLGQQRQPGRVLYADVGTTTFPRILKELLGKKELRSQKGVRRQAAGGPSVAPLPLARTRVASGGVQEVP